MDPQIAGYLASGFPLVGTLDRTCVFPARPDEELMEGADPDWLRLLALESQQHLVDSIRAQEIDEVMREVYKKTCVHEDSELAKRWAVGPFTAQEHLSPCTLPMGW